MTTRHHLFVRSVGLAALIALVVLFSECSQKSPSMTALMQIDSLLLKKDYTGALKEINTIDPASLDEEGRAFYALLLTEAKYKNYDPITSDSLISQAVRYYRDSNDREKATRSLLYQGCVYEVLGEPEKAVDSYNKADESADKHDIANKAYAKLRLGVIYQGYAVGAKKIALEKYFEALQLYRLLPDRHYELLCLTNIGAIYRDFKEEEKQDSALYYIDSAIDLAQKQNEVFFIFSNLYHKAEFYELFKQDYLNAKNFAVQAIRIGGREIDHPRAHYCAAKSYIKLGQIDSALYYLNRSPESASANDSIMYYNLLADISRFRNDNESWLNYHDKAHAMADSILIGSLNAKLLTIEKKYDLQKEELKNVTLRSELKGAWLTVALALLAALALIHFLWRYRNRLRTKENEYELLKSDLDTSLTSLEQMRLTINNYEEELRETGEGYRTELARQEALVSDMAGEIATVKSSLQEKEHERVQLKDRIAALEAKKAQSDEIKAILDGQIKVVHELIQSSHELDEERFAKKFASLMSVPESPRAATYWSNLQVLTNDLYGNILEDAIRQGKGRLRESDVNFIALLCCGYSRTAVMICMRFNNVVTISNKKKKIARKMGVTSLDEFIRPYQEEYQKSLK
jgi:tetratricopeptide (TPR) repeat protein